jgi:hypothetical protein
MLKSILERLHGLLMQERIEYVDLQTITDDIPHLSDAELGMLVTRLAALHRLIAAFQEQRQASTSTPAMPTKRQRRSRKEAE